MTGYRAIIFWRAHEPDVWERERGLPGYQPDPTVHVHDTLAAAERDGAQFGCLAGTTRIEVRGPGADGDDTLHALWDRTSTVTVKTRRYTVRGRMTYDVSHYSNHWQNLSDESKTLHRAEIAEINAALRHEIVAGRNPTPERLVALLRERRAG